MTSTDSPKSTSNSVSSPSRKKTAPKAVPVELGYVEESESWRLESHFFPSKVGGIPAWLSFKPLPTSDTIRCGVCSEPCVFLLQVYAPLDNVRSTAFHRTLYVFVCRNAECCTTNKADNFVALRCQLPRDNDFYGSEPLNLEETKDDSADNEPSHPSIPASVKRQGEYNDGKICAVCACAADKQCAQCKLVHYCCKSHQEIDWKSGGHKESCGKSNAISGSSDKRRNPLAFPEFELVTETERYVEQKPKERSESDRLKAYEEFVQQQKSQGSGGGGGGMTEESVQHLEAMAKAADKDFKLFRRRLEQNPEQVLRYQRGGVPLWADRVNTPRDNDVAPCPVCGGPRIFEFQIMPHLLSYLDVDSVGKSLDWATVAVYTCKDSCDIPERGYAREWLWKQDYAE